MELIIQKSSNPLEVHFVFKQKNQTPAITQATHSRWWWCRQFNANWKSFLRIFEKNEKTNSTFVCDEQTIFGAFEVVINWFALLIARAINGVPTWNANFPRFPSNGDQLWINCESIEFSIAAEDRVLCDNNTITNLSCSSMYELASNSRKTMALSFVICISNDQLKSGFVGRKEESCCKSVASLQLTKID